MEHKGLLIALAFAAVLLLVMIPFYKRVGEGYTSAQVAKCTAAGGTCIDVNTTGCSTTPLKKKCPGGNNIQCCVGGRPDVAPAPGPAPSPAPGPAGMPKPKVKAKPGVPIALDGMNLTYFHQFDKSCQYGTKRSLDSITTVILHNGGKAKKLICCSDWSSKCISSHFAIERDGTIYQLMDLTHRGHHAGNCGNTNTVGIDLEYPVDQKNPVVPAAQSAAVKRLLDYLATIMPSFTNDETHVFSHWMVKGAYGKRGDPLGFDYTTLGFPNSRRKAVAYKDAFCKKAL